MRPSDPMELRLIQAMRQAGIGLTHESDHKSGGHPPLDFYLSGPDLYIEVKQFHTDRIAGQMAQAENVIAIQGAGAVEWFARLLEAKAPR